MAQEDVYPTETVSEGKRLSEVLVIIRFKNKVLEDAIRATKKTIAQISRELGITGNRISALGCFRESPHYQKNGKLKDIAQTLADYFHLDPEILFDRDLYKAKFPRVIEKTIPVSRFVSMAEAKRELLLPAPDEEPPHIDFEEVFRQLTPREAGVIKARFGFEGHEKTFEETGKEFGVSRERVRQIEAKALRKLRHPSRLVDPDVIE